MFEFWNEMLVSNIRCKICWKAKFWIVLTRILRREGWEINDLSPLSWQFFVKFHDLWVVFQRLRVLKQIFVSRKLKYLEFDIMKCSLFLKFVFRKRHFIAENWLCFVLAIRGLLHMSKNFVLWCDFVFLSLLRNLFLWKSFLWSGITMISWNVWVLNHGVVENMCSFSKSYL